jgi:hypothetical protein
MTISTVIAKFIEYEQLYPMHTIRLFGDMSGHIHNEDDEKEFSFDTLDEAYDWLIAQTEVDE